MVCFWGHRDVSMEYQGKILETILYLIEQKGENNFYVGTHGNFDRMVYGALKKAKEKHPSIRYYVVLAYLPSEKNGDYYYKMEETIYPEGMERHPRRFAITYRNRWMVQESKYAVVYVCNSIGNSAKLMKYAEKQGCEIINLGIEDENIT